MVMAVLAAVAGRRAMRATGDGAWTARQTCATEVPAGPAATEVWPVEVGMGVLPERVVRVVMRGLLVVQARTLVVETVARAVRGGIALSQIRPAGTGVLVVTPARMGMAVLVAAVAQALLGVRAVEASTRDRMGQTVLKALQGVMAVPVVPEALWRAMAVLAVLAVSVALEAKAAQVKMERLPSLPAAQVLLAVPEVAAPPVVPGVPAASVGRCEAPAMRAVPVMSELGVPVATVVLLAKAEMVLMV
jgi:hypothetical protein